MKNNEIYNKVAGRIIEELEKGIIPWQQSWFGTVSGPFSRSTGKPYSFINQILLGKPGEYLTFNQIKEAGGKLKKGSKAKMVVFFKPLAIKEQDEEGNEIKKTIPLLRYYNVFHIDDTEGVEPTASPANNTSEPIAEAERIINNYITSGDAPKFTARLSDNAFYSPVTDEVVVPELSQYSRVEEYYSTAFHELVHSTMKESRCNRKNNNIAVAFGGDEYGKEELIAELGSASLVNICGIETTKSFRNSAAYIGGWLEAIKQDKSIITLAAIKAGQAVDFILDSIGKVIKTEDSESDEVKGNKIPLPKAQEKIYNKYSKKELYYSQVDGFTLFTNGSIVFATTGDIAIPEDHKSFDAKAITQQSEFIKDGLFLDHLKLDIKALKASKIKHIAVKTSSNNTILYSIEYLLDSIKFLGIKEDYISVKLYKSGKAKMMQIVNDKGFVYILNVTSKNNITLEYNKQQEIISNYYAA